MISDLVIGGKTYSGIETIQVRSNNGEIITLQVPFEKDIIMRTISGPYVNNNINYIGSYMFASCSSLSYIRCDNVTQIGGSAFSSCGKLSEVSFPNCISIGSNAFALCSMLSMVDFPYCNTIFAGAFRSCYALTTAILPQCTSLLGYTFSSCSSLLVVSLPKCTIISMHDFGCCSNLSTISLPQCVKISGLLAFYSCTSLLSLYLLGSSVATLNHLNAFDFTPISSYGNVRGSIFVPSSLYASYIVATNWSVYADRFVSV